MLVLVNVLDAFLVNVRVGMRHSVVRVLMLMLMLMLMLDMLVVVRRVRMHMRLAVMVVLVGVRGLVSVFVAHCTPVNVGSFELDPRCGASGAPARR